MEPGCTTGFPGCPGGSVTKRSYITIWQSSIFCSCIDLFAHTELQECLHESFRWTWLECCWTLHTYDIIKEIRRVSVYLHPNVNIHIPHTVLSTFSMVMKRRIYLTIRSFLNWWSFPQFAGSLHLIQGWDCKEKLEANNSQELINHGLRE